MKNNFLKRFFWGLFIIVNTVLLYLFLLQLPYGMDTLVLSLRRWSDISPRIEFVAAIALSVAVITVLLLKYLDSEWKSRLVYFRRQFAHPGHRAFFGGKDPGFDRKPLYAAYPEVRDSAYNPQVQIRVWKRLFKRHAKAPLVIGTYHSWLFLRDLYLISLVFMVAFLVAWPLNFGVPVALATSYIFIYGAQLLFLMFSARGTGTRLESNVLAEELGIQSKENIKTKKEQPRKPR